MKNLKFALLALALASVGYGVGRAQNTPVDGPAAEFREARFLAAQERGERFNEFAEAVLKAPKNRDATKQALVYALQDSVDGKADNAGPVIIAQNARIIELLEQLNKKGAK